MPIRELRHYVRWLDEDLSLWEVAHRNCRVGSFVNRGKFDSHLWYIESRIRSPSMKYIPNALTITRIVVTPILLFLLVSDTLTGYAWAFGLFVFASISDYLDGKLARLYKIGSSLGQYLDPFADKILVLGTFIALIFVLPELVPVWAVVLIAVRDVAVTSLRSWARMTGRNLTTMRSAKIKTTFQLTFLILTLLLLTLSRIPGTVGQSVLPVLQGDFLYWFLVVVVLVTLASGVLYFLKLGELLESKLDIDEK